MITNVSTQPMPPDIVLEYVLCPLCKQDSPDVRFRRSDLGLGLPGEFQVVQCRNCSLIYVNPRPTLESIGYYYPADYEPYRQTHLDNIISPITHWEDNRRLNKRAKAVADFKQSGTLLDIGSSTGRFLNQMRTWGTWDLRGVELSPVAAQEARTHYGLDVITGSFQTAHFDAESFDAITLWDVVEHLHDPLADLRRIGKLLKKDGVVVFSIPVCDSLDSKLFGRYWVGYELPRHLTIFSRQTIRQMLRMANLELVDERILYGSDFAFTDSLMYLLQDMGVPKQAYARLHSAMYLWPYRWLVSPVFKVLDLLKLTSLVTIIAKKKYRNYA